MAFADIRLQQLSDNICKDLELLNEYEDALRHEDDPRRMARYRREIERQSASLERYRQEYQELQERSIGESSTELQEVSDQLQQMSAKLDEIRSDQKAVLDGLSELRQTILSHFDASEKLIIDSVVEQLDQNQLTTVQSILAAIEANQIQEAELKEILIALKKDFSEIEQGARQYDQQMIYEIERVSKVLNDPKIDLNNRLKISIPIIPLILSYEGEIALNSGINLRSAWQRLRKKIPGQNQ